MLFKESLRNEVMRFLLRNKTIDEIKQEILEEMQMAWADKKTKIIKLIDPNHKDDIESFFIKKKFDVIDITNSNNVEAPRKLLISWERGIINHEI